MVTFDQGAEIRGGVGVEADVIGRAVLMRVSRTIQPDRASLDHTDAVKCPSGGRGRAGRVAGGHSVAGPCEGDDVLVLDALGNVANARVAEHER
jgi:hypothetical protein